MALCRDLHRWENMSPQAVMEGSKAQAIFALQDAQHDILELGREVARLRSIEVAALNLMQFYRKSLNAGPLSKLPGKEGDYCRALNKALGQ